MELDCSNDALLYRKEKKMYYIGSFGAIQKSRTKIRRQTIQLKLDRLSADFPGKNVWENVVHLRIEYFPRDTRPQIRVDKQTQILHDAFSDIGIRSPI